MINKAILVGNLGKDPELKTTQGGKSVATFSLATSSGSGEKKVTEWHNVTCWEKLADNVAQFLHKGSKAYVEGRITYRKYEKDGATRYITDIVAAEVKFLDSKESGARSAPQEETDDLPF